MIKKGVPIIIDEKGNVITWDYFDSSDIWYLQKEVKESVRQEFKDFESWYKLCFDESDEISKEAWDKLK